MSEVETNAIIHVTRCWVEALVVGEHLCPFARQPLLAGTVQFRVSAAQRPKQLLEDYKAALTELVETPVERLETILLIHPYVLQDFFAYNDFLDEVDEYLAESGYEGEFQVASFHPDYQFADTDFDDVSNFTNRSPYPMLHLLRESSIEQALTHYPNSDAIPQRNIEHLRRLGLEQVRTILRGCQVESSA